jgi:hypothetical protein
MRTRTLYNTGVDFDIEHRTDGWYYRLSQTDDDWEGPFRNVGEITEEFADYFDAYVRWKYELLHKEAPR